MKKILSLCGILASLLSNLDARNAYDTSYMTFKYGLTTIEDNFSLNQHTFSFDLIGDIGYQIKPKLDFSYVSVDEDGDDGVNSLFQTSINAYLKSDYGYQNIIPYFYGGFGYEYVSGSREDFDSSFYLQEGVGIEIPISQPTDNLHIVTELRLMQLIGSKDGQDSEITLFLGLRLPLGNTFTYDGRNNISRGIVAPTYAELEEEIPLQGSQVSTNQTNVININPHNSQTNTTTNRHDLQSDDDGDGVADIYDRCPNTPAKFMIDKFGCPIKDDRLYVEEQTSPYENMSSQTPMQTQTEVVYDSVDVTNTPIATSEHSFRTLPKTRKILNIHFELNSDKVAEESKAIIRKFVMAVNKTSFSKIVVEGYTDSTGDYTKNIELSKRRAEAVKRFMIQYGVDSSRIKSIGKGSLSPIESNDTEFGRARNRRIEIVVH